MFNRLFILISITNGTQTEQFFIGLLSLLQTFQLGCKSDFALLPVSIPDGLYDG